MLKKGKHIVGNHTLVITEKTTEADVKFYVDLYPNLKDIIYDNTNKKRSSNGKVKTES